MECIFKIFYVIQKVLQDVVKLCVESFYSDAIAKVSRYIIHEDTYFFILKVIIIIYH